MDGTPECRESKMGVLRRRAPQTYMSTGKTGPERGEKKGRMRVHVECVRARGGLFFVSEHMWRCHYCLSVCGGAITV